MGARADQPWPKSRLVSSAPMRSTGPYSDRRHRCARASRRLLAESRAPVARRPDARHRPVRRDEARARPAGRPAGRVPASLPRRTARRPRRATCRRSATIIEQPRQPDRRVRARSSRRPGHATASSSSSRASATPRHDPAARRPDGPARLRAPAAARPTAHDPDPAAAVPPHGQPIPTAVPPLFGGDQLRRLATVDADQTGQRAVGFTLKPDGRRSVRRLHRREHTSASSSPSCSTTSVSPRPRIHEPITGGRARSRRRHRRFTQPRSASWSTSCSTARCRSRCRKSRSTRSARRSAQTSCSRACSPARSASLLVFVFMLLHYRLPGLIACFALILLHARSSTRCSGSSR